MLIGLVKLVKGVSDVMLMMVYQCFVIRHSSPSSCIAVCNLCSLGDLFCVEQKMFVSIIECM